MIDLAAEFADLTPAHWAHAKRVAAILEAEWHLTGIPSPQEGLLRAHEVSLGFGA